MKDGRKSSEFMMGLAALVLPVLVYLATSLWGEGHWLVGALAAVGTAIGAGVTSAGYSASRAKVKAAESLREAAGAERGAVPPPSPSTT